MDDIIVLILTLIFIIAGVFGQMKKRQTNQGEEPEADNRIENPDRNVFWEHLHDDLDEPEPEKTVPVVQKLKRTKNIEQEYLFNVDDEGKRIFTRNKEKKVPVSVIVKSSKGKRFPLKKAVILSEILNRKYI
jgi:hypothetical protein